LKVRYLSDAVLLDASDADVKALWVAARALSLANDNGGMKKTEDAAGHEIRINNKNQGAQALFTLAQALFHRPAPPGDGTPKNNALRRLWDHLRPNHRTMLGLLAERGTMTQLKLEEELGLEPEAFRGLVAGMSKIAKGLRIDLPMDRTGYQREQRTYTLRPVGRATFSALAKRPV
jgi:hypothetical protein